jgi:predicted MFS family arabinose efflux permease
MTAEAATPDVPLRRYPDFLKLWGGQSVSLFGSQITEVALPLTAVLVLHANAAQMGFLNTARWLPFLVFTLWVGAWVDRVRRLPLLIAFDVGRALVMGTIVALALGGRLHISTLVGLVFVFGAMTVVFEVSYYSFVPCVVPRDQLVVANSRLQASNSIAQVGGPSLGGVLVQALTAPYALLVDAISFVFSALSLISIRTREPTPEADPAAGGTLSRIREGLGITYRNPYLRALAGVAGFYNLFEQWILTLFVLYAVRRLGMSAGSIGLVLSAGAVGALVGSVAAVPAGRRIGVGKAVLYSVLLECAVMLVVPVTPAHSMLTFPLLALAFGLNGLGMALSSVIAVTVRQIVTPDRLLGRMNASYRFVSYGAIPLGALLGGLAGQMLGVRAGLAVGCVALLSTIVWILFSPLARLRELEDAAV